MKAVSDAEKSVADVKKDGSDGMYGKSRSTLFSKEDLKFRKKSNAQSMRIRQNILCHI